MFEDLYITPPTEEYRSTEISCHESGVTYIIDWDTGVSVDRFKLYQSF